MKTTRLNLDGNPIQVSDSYFDEQGNYCGDEDWYPNGHERDGLCIGATDFKTGKGYWIDPDWAYVNPPTLIGTVYYRGEIFEFENDGDEEMEEVPHALFSVKGYDNPLVLDVESDLYQVIDDGEVKQVESHLYQIIHWSEVEKNDA
jgi:hypothetical protein